MRQAITDTMKPTIAQSPTILSSEFLTIEKANRAACKGDIVTLDLDLTPEDGFVPEPLFDTTGRVSFVLGWGNYLPGLHELVTGMKINDEVQNVSIDAGWGERNPDLIIEFPKANLKKFKLVDTIQVGSVLNLQHGIEVTVIHVTDEFITVDANPPLAGSSYTCSFKILSIDPPPPLSLLGFVEPDHEDPTTSKDTLSSSRHEVATFAMGCFWGGELAFMRVPGVVGTKVGYTHGITVDPTYEEVCAGVTKHREAVMVMYDPQVVSYKQLFEVFLERLAVTASPYKIDLFQEEDEDDDDDDDGSNKDDSQQYRHGVYYHSEKQRQVSLELIDADNIFKIEVKQAATFYNAEPYHQQYLLKGGQSAKKGAKATIRCFG